MPAYICISILKFKKINFLQRPRFFFTESVEKILSHQSNFWLFPCIRKACRSLKNRLHIAVFRRAFSVFRKRLPLFFCTVAENKLRESCNLADAAGESCNCAWSASVFVPCAKPYFKFLNQKLVFSGKSCIFKVFFQVKSFIVFAIFLVFARLYIRQNIKPKTILRSRKNYLRTERYCTLALFCRVFGVYSRKIDYISRAKEITHAPSYCMFAQTEKDPVFKAVIHKVFEPVYCVFPRRENIVLIAVKRIKRWLRNLKFCLCVKPQIVFRAHIKVKVRQELRCESKIFEALLYKFRVSVSVLVRVIPEKHAVKRK